MSNFHRCCRPTIYLIGLLLLGCRGDTQSAPADVTSGVVRIEIVTGGPTETVEIGDIASGTTLEQVMRSVTEPEVGIKGSGTTAFVDRIGDLATGATEGWTFEVDGEFANQGIGNTKLSPPTTVTWTYRGYDAND